MLKKTILFLFLLGTDQLSKYIIRQSGGFYICNKGVAFGISGIYFWIILFLIIALFAWQRKNLQTLFFDRWLAIIFILSGALSNVLDRFIFGCVVDFVDFKIWPLFNLADVYIVIGFVIIFLKHFQLQKTKI